MKRRRPNPERFKCPWCGARPGQKCRRPNGVKISPHAVRHRLAFP